MSRVTALVFDFNGTLSHDEPVLCAVYQELFAEWGRPLPEATYYEQLVRSLGGGDHRRLARRRRI